MKISSAWNFRIHIYLKVQNNPWSKDGEAHLNFRKSYNEQISRITDKAVALRRVPKSEAVIPIQILSSSAYSYSKPETFCL
jgi:hypothetical protein